MLKNPNPKMKTIILTTCNNSFEANLIKGMLENNGIKSFVLNENASSLLPHLNGIMGAGVQVMIDASDLETAKELIASQSVVKEIICPCCGSTNVKFGLGSNKLKMIFAILLSLFFWVPFGYIKNTYYCKDCKTEFKI